MIALVHTLMKCPVKHCLVLAPQRCLRSGLRVIDMVWVLVVLVVTSDGTDADVE